MFKPVYMTVCDLMTVKAIVHKMMFASIFSMAFAIFKIFDIF